MNQPTTITQPKMLGVRLALKALEALSDSRFEQGSGFCERYARQVFEACYPARQDASKHFLASARTSMDAFQGTGFVFLDNVGGMTYATDVELEHGDFVYKGVRTSGVAGHVGIVFTNIVKGEPQLCVAENSSYHINNPGPQTIQGAKGWRTLEQFGAFEMVVRFDGK